MNARRKRILVLAAVLFATTLSIVGWSVIKVVAWARDLPNRIVIDVDAMADAFEHSVWGSYHMVLRDGDTATQLDVLNDQFAPLAREHEDGAAWIRSEFRDDIAALINSDDCKVSAAASDLIELLDAPPTQP